MSVFIKVPLRVKTKKIRKRYSLFSLNDEKKDALVADETLNCRVENGALCVGVGGRAMEFPLGEGAIASNGLPENSKLFFMPAVDGYGNQLETIGALDNDGFYYTYDAYTRVWGYEREYGCKMRAVFVVNEDGKRRLVFIGKNACHFFVYGGITTRIPLENLGEKSHLACYVQGRLFYVSAPYTLCYSTPFKTEDFAQSIKDGGSIQLPTQYGDIVDVVAFGGKVYIFFEQGIFCLETAGAASEFKVKEVPYRGGNIFEDSMGVGGKCGEKLFFLTEQGVCKLEKDRVERVCKSLPFSIKWKGQVCGHGSFEGQYAVCFYDKNNEKKCIVVDGETEEGYYAFTPDCLSDYKGGAVCVFDGEVMLLHRSGVLPNESKATFFVGGLDFGESGRKRMETLRLEGTGEAEICIENGKQSKVVRIALDKGQGQAKIGLCGALFSIRFTLKEGTKIRAVDLALSKLLGAE